MLQQLLNLLSGKNPPKDTTPAETIIVEAVKHIQNVEKLRTEKEKEFNDKRSRGARRSNHRLPL